MSYRIQFLQFITTRPLSLLGFSLSIFTTLSLTALIVENNFACTPELIVWALTENCRSLIVLVIRVYISTGFPSTGNLSILRHSAPPCVVKIWDILQVFGVVWFPIGNLLLFNNTGCANVTPLTFFAMVYKIGEIYLSFFIPYFIRCSIRICPPEGHNNRNLVFGPSVGSPDLNETDSGFWKNWLEGFGCKEFVFDSNEMKNHQTEKENHIMKIENQENQIKNNEKSKTTNTSYKTCQQNENKTDELKSKIDELDGLEEKNDKTDEIHGAINETEKNHFNNNKYQILFISSTKSHEFSESEGVELGEKEVNMDDSRVLDGINGSNDDNCCAVCLLPFQSSPAQEPVDLESGIPPEETNEEKKETHEENLHYLVHYPCTGRHLFHAECLKSWLQVASARAARDTLISSNPRLLAEAALSRGLITCPCCRECSKKIVFKWKIIYKNLYYECKSFNLNNFQRGFENKNYLNDALRRN